MKGLVRAPLLLLLATSLLSTVAPAREQPSPQMPAAPARPKTPSLYDSLSGSVVTITTSGRDGKELASGSGVIISPDGSILTNYHVVEGGTFFDVRFAHGHVKGDSVPARAAECAPALDLAVLRVTPNRQLKAARVTRTLPGVGSRVYALGSPLELEGTLSDGIVSQVRNEGGVVLIQTTAPVSPGSSGGGLFTSDGQLVGITTFTLKGGQGLNFAVSTIGIQDLQPCEAFPALERPSEQETEAASSGKICSTLDGLVESIGKIIGKSKRAHDQFVRDVEAANAQISEATRTARTSQELLNATRGVRPRPNEYHYDCLAEIKSLKNDLEAGRFDVVPKSITAPVSLAVTDLQLRWESMISAISREGSDRSPASLSDEVLRAWAATKALQKSLRHGYSEVQELCPRIKINFGED